MRSLPLLLAAFLIAAVPALAQDSQGRSRVPPSSSGGSGSSGGGTAVPRDSSPPPPPATAPAPTPRTEGDGQRRAVPRTGPVPRRGDGGRVYGGGIYGYDSPRNYYYYYPRRLYPYGYGAFGLGYFYYDPYYWGPPYAQGYPGYPYYGDDAGQVRLKVKPRDAEVYVNGYYAGRVDDFDGYFQGLKLEEGGYHISIVAPGYEPLEFDIRVIAGRTVSYEGELLRRRP